MAQSRSMSAAVVARLVASGPAALDDQEALQVAAGLTAEQAATLFAEFGSLPEVLAASPSALSRLAPVLQAARLGLMKDIARRLLVAPLRQRPVLSAWEVVADYLRAMLAGRSREQLLGLFLNKRNRLILCEVWHAVLADLADRGLVDADGRLAGGGSDTPTAPPPPGRRARAAAARRLWSEGRPLGRSLSAHHLALRYVSPPLEGLRHHSEVPAAVYAWAGPRRPALLAAIRAPVSGEVVGVEVTYLAPNGTRARLRLPRKTVGLCPPGAAVRLAAPGPRLLVGEGVFSCLSAAERFGLPAWADRGARTSTTEQTEAAISAARPQREHRSFLS